MPADAGNRRDLSAQLAVVEVGGGDAARFLQAQLSCDVARLGSDHACYGAYLSPQGRVLATLYVVPVDGGFHLLLHPTLVEAVPGRLAKYVLRDDVRIGALPQLTISGEGQSTPSGRAPDLSMLPVSHVSAGCQLQLPDGRRLWIAPEPGSLPAHRWSRADFEQGIAGIEERTSDKHIPQALGLDRIGAVCFTKGCYPGQEIVARVHYRGRAKRGLALLRARSALAPASELIDPLGARCGEILACAADDDGGFLALAVTVEGAQEFTGSGGEPLTPLRSFGQPA